LETPKSTDKATLLEQEWGLTISMFRLMANLLVVGQGELIPKIKC